MQLSRAKEIASCKAGLVAAPPVLPEEEANPRLLVAGLATQEQVDSVDPQVVNDVFAELFQYLDPMEAPAQPTAIGEFLSSDLDVLCADYLPQELLRL